MTNHALQDRIDILSQRTGMIENDPKLIDDLPVIEAITMYGMSNNPGSTVSVDNEALDQSQFTYRELEQVSYFHVLSNYFPLLKENI